MISKLDNMNNIYHNDFYKFIRYDSEEEKEYWKTVNGGKEGYLQRRKERISKLNNGQKIRGSYG